MTALIHSEPVWCITQFWPVVGLGPVPTTVSSYFKPLGVSVISDLYSEIEDDR